MKLIKCHPNSDGISYDNAACLQTFLFRKTGNVNKKLVKQFILWFCKIKILICFFAKKKNIYIVIEVENKYDFSVHFCFASSI